VIDIVRGQIVGGFVGPLARVMARTRALRERAFYNLSQDYYSTLDELLPRSVNPGRALEVGCGSGLQLRGLNGMGWRAEGIEWDGAAAVVASATSGALVHRGDFRTAQLPTGVFDLILLHHVLEHLDTPRSALARAWELLRPTGTLVLVYPNPISLAARLFGHNWFHWDPPRHLVLVPPAMLTALAIEHGFRVVSLRTTNRNAAYGYCYSRALRSGRHPVTSGPPDSCDRMLARLERVCRAFWHAGQEVVVALRRP
jgi:SAM-dependent methyltransferase